MKERGELRLGASDHVEKDSFLLALIDQAVENGDVIKNSDLNIIFVSVDASLADRLISIGISRMYNYKGQDVMLIINSNQDVQF